MPEPLAAWPMPGHDTGTRPSRRAQLRAHIIRPGTDRCGSAHLDVAHPVPAGEVPVGRRCQSKTCRAGWPEPTP